MDLIPPKKIFRENELDQIAQLLDLAFIDDPIFQASEFHTLTGCSWHSALALTERWPSIDISSEPEWLLVWGTISNLVGYPHGQHQRISSNTGLDRDKMKEFLARLAPYEPE